MAPSPERLKAHEMLSADITRISKQAKLPFRTLPDLVNTKVRYPELIPLLIDWLKNLDGRTPMTDPQDLAKFRENLARALTTVDAVGTEAVPVLFEQFYLNPPLPPINSHAVGNALLHLAVPSDYDRMAALAVDRSLSSGRAAILEWLIKQRRPEGLEIVVGEIEDPSVRALGIKYLRRYKPLPAGVKPKVERYLDDPDSEVRKQTKLTLQKLPA
ncbi:hypothetical protein BJD99_00200 [Rhodococcus sp. 1163]|uniref:hypothetical protein n=1 Tax=Rhodococcus sp. 1163 TaxID=1905289 RepID=UPI0009FC9119|nr:hypothetical protein [Rhodococcus sp. 1163]ORI13122.1 hypothetical protein BJD99_00200 [Rhodococcus sp. 1163]